VLQEERGGRGDEDGRAITGPPPPPREATWRPTRGVAMGPVEVPEERRVHNELSGDPAAFLRAIPFPVSQVLEPPTPVAHPQ